MRRMLDTRKPMRRTFGARKGGFHFARGAIQGNGGAWVSGDISGVDDDGVEAEDADEVVKNEDMEGE